MHTHICAHKRIGHRCGAIYGGVTAVYGGSAAVYGGRNWRYGLWQNWSKPTPTMTLTRYSS
eukprot:3631290-Rhodomonas_salina.2